MEDISNYVKTRNILLTLDIILAILIISSAYFIIDTPLGLSSLIFGFVMLTIITILKILDKF
ncbi:MAG: hypothetical protein AABW65_01405 [Nanoarchaeota archaeon]